MRKEPVGTWDIITKSVVTDLGEIVIQKLNLAIMRRYQRVVMEVISSLLIRE